MFVCGGLDVVGQLAALGHCFVEGLAVAAEEAGLFAVFVLGPGHRSVILPTVRAILDFALLHQLLEGPDGLDDVVVILEVLLLLGLPTLAVVALAGRVEV